MSINYEISILKTSTTNSFEENDVKAYLTDGNDNALVNPILISNLGNSKKIANAKVIYNNSFMYNNSNEIQTHTYRLRVWLKSDINMSKYTVKQEIDDSKTNISLTGCTFKFKVNVSTVEETGADTLIKLTNNQSESGLYTITHSADNTLQIGATESITEYRYRGASPKNYVTFNNEVWRILGIFPTDDGTGKIENRIKIIKDQSIGNKKWDTGNSNNWARPATLNTELNTTYLNSLDSTTQNMIGNTKYYLGGYSNFSIQKDAMYQYERKIQNTTSNEFYNGTNPNSFIGKLGLMYASDYGYAVSDECTQNLNGYDNATCKNNNWLFKGNDEWILPQIASYSSLALFVYSDGGVNLNDREVRRYLNAVRPVLYLTASVQIIDGDGTSTNPYTFGL